MADEKIKVQIIADGSQVGPEVSKVKKHLGGLDDTASLLGSSFAKLGGIVAGALSVGAITSNLAAAGKAAIAFGDEMQKAAARTGIGAGQFALLADAAKMSDVDVQLLSGSLQKMQVALSQAGSGSRTANQALAALGLTFNDLQRLAPEDQFLRIADQISKVESPADRTRAAVELFGKSGANLLPFFEQGARGIEAATDEIKRMGGAITDAQIERLADVDEAVKRLGQSWSNFARELTARVAPAITHVLDLLSNADTAKADAVRASQINALLTSRGDTADYFPDTAALRKELADIERRQKLAAARAAELERRTLLGTGSDRQATRTLPPPGFGVAAPAPAIGRVAADAGKIVDAAAWREGEFDVGKAIARDPLTDPKYLYQQQLGAALEQLATDQARSQLNIAEVGNASILDSLLLNHEYMIAAEQAKNMTLGESLTSMVGLAMQQGGALGKFGKAFAIAQTIWSGGTAIIESYKNAGGYPLGIPAAAAMAAQVASQLANIKKTNIGSSGSVAGAKGGGASGGASALQDMPATSGQGGQKLEQQSAVQVHIHGNLIENGSTAAWLAEVLGEAINGRDLVFINNNSRQAAELRT